jgi:hypothetical protein
MSVRAAALVATGASAAEGTASGIGLAFLVGAVLSLGAIAVAFFVRTSRATQARQGAVLMGEGASG